MNQDKKILDVISAHLGLIPEDIDRHANLHDELGLGPVQLNDLLAELSNKFDVIFTPEDVEHLEDIEDLIFLVEDNLID